MDWQSAAWHALANWINPVLGGLWVLAARRKRPPRGTLVRALLSAALSVALVHAVRLARPLPADPLFPSGHEAFAASVAVSLSMLDRRWAFPAFGLAALLGVSLVFCGYHALPDVAASLILCSLLTRACFVNPIKRQPPRRPSGSN